ncbi:MAG: hypothetical protein QOG73_1809 [Acetobacteraceae bacterium]|jgi:hypothetical protein|nr:hypothetical protein [Acetobacteraceae bacterium]
MLVGLGAVAGAFGVAAMMSAATAPAARADALTDVAIQDEENQIAYDQSYLQSLPQSEQAYLGPEYTQLANMTDQLEAQESPAFPDNDLSYDWMFSPASFAGDPSGYATDVFDNLWSPLMTLGNAAGLDYGAAGPIAGIALDTETGAALLSHLPGALEGGPTHALDAVHAWIEMPEFLFSAGSIAADGIPGAQPAGLAFDAFATGLGGLDNLVTNLWGG